MRVPRHQESPDAWEKAQNVQISIFLITRVCRSSCGSGGRGYLLFGQDTRKPQGQGLWSQSQGRLGLIAALIWPDLVEADHSQLLENVALSEASFSWGGGPSAPSSTSTSWPSTLGCFLGASIQIHLSQNLFPPGVPQVTLTQQAGSAPGPS